MYTTRMLVQACIISALVMSTMSIYFEDGNLTISISNEELSWDDAMADCAQEGGHLVTMESDHVHGILSNLMAIAGDTRMWLGVRMIDLGWVWADNSGSTGNFSVWSSGTSRVLSYPKRGSASNAAYPLCAMMVGSEDFTWLDHPCAMPHAFICENDALCDSPDNSVEISATGDHRCFTVHHSTLSWYQAREACALEGSRLAVLSDAKIYQQLKRHLTEILRLSGDYWIGYSDSILQWGSGGYVSRTFWEGGQPSRRGRCVQLERFGERSYLWSNQDCKQKQPYACNIPFHAKIKADVVQDIEESQNNRCEIYRSADIAITESNASEWSIDGFLNSAKYSGLTFAAGCLLMLIPLTILAIKLKRSNSIIAKSKERPLTENVENNQYEHSGGTNVGFGASTEQLTYPQNIYQAYRSQQQKYGDNVYSDGKTGTVLYNV